jgi:hypothetical protein
VASAAYWTGIVLSDRGNVGKGSGSWEHLGGSLGGLGIREIADIAVTADIADIGKAKALAAD